ncbi:arf-GAP domain and FG repeat-containing protein 1a isoform X2 [Hypomesus transpacificus]|uniref:arf-GAP domain and FG repeat-containing protein 1a isoform X2 n=1 Tax=Hypomesus transpacificus TaxID=137520 RepID=UPI001F07CABE|nr:arf-GAP domain and FG repeat-containing protein 1a isoform X2 [Hypomesus transpacificus]
MAASAKRKQEEKHLKMLREMTSLSPNRKCFDCDQRGPTYANMTVGSFVCTSCSGILRGLNPPHRVKSISMTTFTQQEIELLQKNGNEVCKQIWLGLYDDRTSSIPDFREPQKVKEFLQEKYEKKRWYVPPDQAKVVASVHASISGSSNSSTSSTPEVRPLKTLLGEGVPTLHLSKHTPSQSPVVSRSQAHQQFQDKKFDLLSDLGGDIFAAPPSKAPGPANFANFAHFNSHPASHSTAANADFANADFANADFANFEVFRSAGPSGAFPPAPPAPFQPSQTGNSLPSRGSLGPGQAGLSHPQSQLAGLGGDRYAPLAELDTVFSPPAPPTSAYNTSSQGGMYPSVPAASASQAQQGCLPSMPQGFGGPSTNPFVAAAVVPGAAHTNPFQSNGRAAAVAAAGGGFSGYGPAKPMVTPFGQVMAAPGVSSNPFLAGAPSAQYPAGGSSTNPFL